MIVVLGIIAAVVVFGVARFKNDATQAACDTVAGTIKSAAGACHAKYGAYPANEASLTAPAPSNYLVSPVPTNPAKTYSSGALPVAGVCSGGDDGVGGGVGGGGLVASAEGSGGNGSYIPTWGGIGGAGGNGSVTITW